MKSGMKRLQRNRNFRISGRVGIWAKPSCILPKHYRTKIKMQFIMNRIYLRIFGLTILLIQMALIGYTAFTVKELPHRYQQEFDNATKRLAIEEWSNHNAKKQDQLSSEDAILAKAKDISIESIITAYDAEISKLLSKQIGLLFLLILTSIASFVLPLED